MRRVLRPVALAVATVTGLLGVLALLRAADPLHEGLTATYFSDPSWTSSPVLRHINPPIEIYERIQ